MGLVRDHHPDPGGARLSDGARGDMQNRAMQTHANKVASQNTYIQEASGSGGSSADESEKLANLHQRGALTDEEFQAERSKLLS